MEALFFAGVRELLDDVAFEGGGVHDIEGVGGLEHGETVMVLGGDDHVFLAGVLGEFDEVIGVELGGVELVGVLFVLGGGDLGVVLDPLAEVGNIAALVDAGGSGVDAPVDEHAETGFAPPLHAGVFLFLGLGGLDDGRRCAATRPAAGAAPGGGGRAGGRRGTGCGGKGEHGGSSQDAARDDGHDCLLPHQRPPL